MPASRQATGVGLPCAIDTSIWRSSVTICSALNLFFGMTQAPFQAHFLTKLGPRKPGQVITSDEARLRLSKFGPNATPDVALHPLRLVLSKFLAPISVLLELAIVLQLVLGEYIEASIIGLLLIFNAAIGFFHESRAQSTIAALKSRLALNASVLRDGSWATLPAAELVPGDID